MISNYNEFIVRVNELGFMFFSDTVNAYPSLSGETREEQWHTGDFETDPWKWKDRAAEEKQVAFGCILGGNKGFIASWMYPYFYIAARQNETLEEKWENGSLSPQVWELWNLFQKKTMLNTSDIRYEMGVTMKKGGSKVDSAIIELQKCFYITVAGSRRKLNKFGEPYGWAANVYDVVENWAPKEWLQDCDKIGQAEAKQKILEVGVKNSNPMMEKAILKALRL